MKVPIKKSIYMVAKAAIIQVMIATGRKYIGCFIFMLEGVMKSEYFMLIKEEQETLCCPL